MSFTSNPLSTAFGQSAGNQMALSQQGLSQQMQQFMLALQFQQQQAALQQAMNLGTQFGSAPGGNWTSWPTSQSMQPLPGTPTQSMQNQYLQQALAAAGLTGQFTNPSQFMYQPGTFVRNRDDGGIGQVQANGSLRTFGSMDEYRAAGGTDQAVMQMPQLSAAEFGNLTNTNNQTPQNTMAASALTGMYQGAPTTAYQQQMLGQLGQGAALTGTYYDPSKMTYQPGTFVRDAGTGGIGQIQANGQLRMFGSMGEYLAAGGTQAQVGNLPSVSDAEYYNLAQPGAQGGGQQTLAAQLQNAQLTGMYNGSPTQSYQAQGQQEAQAWAQLYGYTPQLNANGQPIVPGATGNGVTPQTLAAQLQNAQLSGVYGYNYQPGTFVKDADTGGIGQIQQNGTLRMFGSMDEFTQAGGTNQMIAGLPSVSDAQYQQLASQGQTGTPTEAASEYARTLAEQQRQANMQNAIAQGQLGQQYLSTAAQLQGPQNTFQLSNYLRGAQGNPNVPVYLQNLQNNLGLPSFQAPGSTAPTPQSAAGLTSQMGYGVNGTPQYDANGQPITGSYSSATPGWDYNSTLNSINQIAQRGAQGLAPGSLERLNPDELSAFGSGLGAAGYSLPSFLQQYQNSRVGQQAGTGVMSFG